MIHKSAVLAGNDEFWHSAIIDDSCTASSSTDSDSCLSSPSSPSTAGADSLPGFHHQLLSNDVPSYECLTGYDHRGEDASSSLFFDEDEDMLTSTTHHEDDEDDTRMMTSCCRQQEKMSSVKKRGGGSWLLGFARLQSRPNVDDDYSDDEEEEEPEVAVEEPPSKSVTTLEQHQEDDDTPPGLVRTNSVSDFSFSTSSEDDNSTTTSDTSNNTEDDDLPKKKSVGFNSTVKIQPVPHSFTYTPIQRRKMYSTSLEVRKNKIRNKREYRYDGCDWRNVTEEWEMSVDMVTGELVHPVHNHVLWLEMDWKKEMMERKRGDNRFFLTRREQEIWKRDVQ